jgi:hypothetical protein
MSVAGHTKKRLALLGPIRERSTARRLMRGFLVVVVFVPLLWYLEGREDLAAQGVGSPGATIRDAWANLLWSLSTVWTLWLCLACLILGLCWPLGEVSRRTRILAVVFVSVGFLVACLASGGSVALYMMQRASLTHG